MFTGIITNLGKVKSKTKNTLTIQAGSELIAKLDKGTSISVDGICLTVVNTGKDYFQIDFMEETEEKTNIKYLKEGDLVNLELPATPASFLSGHIVQGHVDGLGKIKSQISNVKSQILKITIPNSLSKYIVSKGSIALNGISLTVVEVGRDFFTVGIIPHTWKNTMLNEARVGSVVNIEVDILAKYMERLLKR